MQSLQFPCGAEILSGHNTVIACVDQDIMNNWCHNATSDVVSSIFNIIRLKLLLSQQPCGSCLARLKQETPG